MLKMKEINRYSGWTTDTFKKAAEQQIEALLEQFCLRRYHDVMVH